MPPSKYLYDKLYVSAFVPRLFAPVDNTSLRLAVDFLRTLPQTAFVGITVEVNVKAGPYKLRAPAHLTLSEIEGKTPAQVWKAFDAEVDRQIEYFENRARGNFSV
jgi:hypothetical protein